MTEVQTRPGTEHVMSMFPGEYMVQMQEYFGLVICVTNRRTLLLGCQSPREVCVASFSMETGRA